MRIRNFIFVLMLFGILRSSLAQDTTIQLVSKMDIQPNYSMWDGHQTMLMGYTQLLGAPIELPSPTITVYEGDSVELKLRNFSQPAPHTIHLHGLDVDQQNDGVPHLSFQVNHGENKSYFFKAPHPGTYIYHCHVFSSLHVQGGMYGMLIVKPNQPNITWDGGYSYNKEYSWLTSEIDTHWHTDAIINQSYDSTIMSYAIPDFNPQYFLVNGKSESQLDLASEGVNANANENLFVRLANIGFCGNRYIFPEEMNARIISSDGRPLPSVDVADTVILYPGERYGVLLNSTVELTDSIKIDYTDMNTGLVKNQQKIPLEINGFAGIPEQNIPEFIIYPNPSNDLVNIEFARDLDQLEIQLFAMDGRLIEEREITNQKSIFLSIENLPRGIFVLRMKINEQYSISRKLVKN